MKVVTVLEYVHVECMSVEAYVCSQIMIQLEYEDI